MRFLAMEVPVLNMSGKKVGTLTIDELALGGEVNPSLIKQAYVRYHANRRQGSSRTKNRSLVEGSTKKLYRQKGTGNARMGAKRTNLRRGGGVTFAKRKTHEDFRLEMPIKMRRKANRNALLAKLIDGEVKVIDNLSMKQPRTGEFKQVLAACGVNRTCLVAVDPENLNVGLSARNIDGVTVCNSRQLTCFEMLNHRFMVISKSDLQDWISGASSKTDKSARVHEKEVA